MVCPRSGDRRRDGPSRRLAGQDQGGPAAQRKGGSPGVRPAGNGAWRGTNPEV